VFKDLADMLRKAPGPLSRDFQPEQIRHAVKMFGAVSDAALLIATAAGKGKPDDVGVTPALGRFTGTGAFYDTATAKFADQRQAQEFRDKSAPIVQEYNSYKDRGLTPPAEVMERYRIVQSTKAQFAQGGKAINAAEKAGDRAGANVLRKARTEKSNDRLRSVVGHE
jgi:hypothetical protein